MNIAIIAVAYNRVDSLSRLLGSLSRAYYNEDATLIISVDKSNTDVVERFAEEYKWPHGVKIVDKHKKNLGLRAHMMSLGKWFDKFDAIVVLEDDLVVSPNYYYYTQQAVKKYQDNPDVAGISLYGIELNYQNRFPFIPIKDEHDVYFMNCAISWGEVWMRDSWLLFYSWYLNHQDFPVLPHLPISICRWSNKSWLKYHIRYCIEENKLFVHPYYSLTTNYGEAGEHNDGSFKSLFQVSMQNGKKIDYLLPDIKEKAVCYDGFFENMALYTVLGINKDELCLDLNGERHNNSHCRYWLTTEVSNHKIIKSYGLNYRPIELNVMLNNPGKDIFLYDTWQNEEHSANNKHELILYRYRISNMTSFVKKYGIIYLVRQYICVYSERIGKALRFKKYIK